MPKRIRSKKDAKEVLKHGTVHGKALSKKQKGLFGAAAGGSKSALRKLKGKKRSRKRR